MSSAASAPPAARRRAAKVAPPTVSAGPAVGEDKLPSVLIMTHSHPMETRGGAEIAAWTLFRGLESRAARSWFLGCAGSKTESRLGATLTQPHGPNNYLYQAGAEFDYFKFANPDPNFPKALGRLVAELKPDIVHSHHFSRFGVESFSIVKRASPKTKIVLSLHEFLAICHHHGQMVKTGTMQPCERASDVACSGCFPQFKPRDFFLRKRYIQTFLEDVDLFISPSRFLAQRFKEWGLPEGKLAVLENMPPAKAATMPEPKAEPSRPPPPGKQSRASATAWVARPLRFGFFGQMSPLKGIAVLIDAARYLREMEVHGATIEIHGDYSSQPPAFQAAVAESLVQAGESVVYHGVYDNRDVNRLMRRMDAIIVPSTWWENSPVVIQEAFTNGKPVICSNIGGMAEKVIPGVNGLHFDVGQPRSLARLLKELVDDPQRLDDLKARMAPPLSMDAALDAHLALYRSLKA